MIICGERDWHKGIHSSVRFTPGVRAWEDSDSTQNTLQTKANEEMSGPFWAATMMRPVPTMEIGAADSMSIAATLVYILDISGESVSRASARIWRRRRHIIEVTTTFKPTLSETHGTATRATLPFGKDDEEGRALSTIVMIASTGKKSRAQ